MIEMRQTGPGRAELWEDGKSAGAAQWSTAFLSWGRERVKVAVIARLTAPEDRAGDFWEYLVYLWQKEGVAAAWREGALLWFSRALQESWQAAGAPMELTEDG